MDRLSKAQCDRAAELATYEEKAQFYAMDRVQRVFEALGFWAAVDDVGRQARALTRKILERDRLTDDARLC